MKQAKARRWYFAHWPEIALPALTLMFGMQMLRALLPYLQYILADRFGRSSIDLGLIALVIFATSFLVGPAGRLLGLRRLLRLSAGGAGLARFGMQLWRGDPVGDMALAVIGFSLFSWFLPLSLARLRLLPAGQRGQAGGRLAGSFLLGLALDTALHGAFATYDYVWQSGSGPILLATLLVVLQGTALQSISATVPNEARLAVDTAFGRAWPWLAIGPWLFLELLILQNIAHLTALSHWSLPVAFFWLTFSHLAGLGALVRFSPARPGLLALVGLVLLTIQPWGGDPPPILTGLVFLLGQMALASLLGTIIIGLAQAETQPGWKNTTISHGLTMLLMVILTFGFYITYSLAVPYSRYLLFPLAGLIILLAALGASRRSAQPAATGRPDWSLVYRAAPLLLLPLGLWLARQTPEPTPAAGGPIRVMTYNVHNGFNTEGQLDLEAIAQVIAAQAPDVVSLQEVSRGWAVNGSADMATWLSRRLGMAYTFSPYGDAVWGHAVLSRRPILQIQTRPLPPAGLLIKRSFSFQQLDWGDGKTLSLLNTHYHHIPADSAIRVEQSAVIRLFLAGQPAGPVVLTGDLNAEPDKPELARLFEFGLRDVVREAGAVSGYTYPASAPVRQLDYILISPDLTATGVEIIASPASDHRPIVVTLASE